MASSLAAHSTTRSVQIAPTSAPPCAIPSTAIVGTRVAGSSLRRSQAQPVQQATRGVKVFAAAVADVSEEAPMTEKLRIKLKTYDVPVMKEAVQMILDAAASTGATISGPVPLPTKIKKWCVLRSPHVNKDSREHFEIRIHSRLIDIKDLSAQTIDSLMALDLPAGVDANVKLM
ncbi:hypothetical protein BSKO_03973 [Bryopsis sp. KO-2023]|nr:hypothetical protein BSKO_03973 [Bryopsis sp. KO-2023]